MKSLFYKDIIALKENFKELFVVFVFGFVMIISNFVDMAYMMSSFWLIYFLIKIFDTEYENNFYKYVIYSGVNEKIIVIYRYILVLFTILFVFFINFLMAFITEFDKNIYRFLIFSISNIFIYEILIPIFFRFGKISKKLIRIFIGIIYTIWIFYIVKDGSIIKFEKLIDLNLFFIIIVIILILFLFLFSLLISLKFIKQKISE